MDNKKLFLEEFFKSFEESFKRAKSLYSCPKFKLEGVTMLICQIAALASCRYPEESDWKSFKDIIYLYSGKKDIYENIDLLFFYQWPKSILNEHKKYKKLKNYESIKEIFISKFGEVERIKNNRKRYQKRENLKSLLFSSGVNWFDSKNFLEYIELFSNNQIFYKYARCNAIHSYDFPLINIGCRIDKKETIYTDNHQITGDIIIKTIEGILINIRKKSLEKNKWPHELCD